MKIFAAPLQGYTDRHFRNAHYSVIGGIEEYYTPFLRLEKDVIREKELPDVDKKTNLSPETVPQILVKSGAELAFFAEKLGREMGWKRLDINFGCPHIPVVKRGYGAGVLEEKSAIIDVLKATEKFPFIRFSVKCRLPEKDEKILEIFQEYPLEKIVLHPRKCSWQYKGTADKEAFYRFLSSGGKNPVVYNGDIRTVDDVPEKVDMLMLGRGLLCDPLLARKIKGEIFSIEEENLLYRKFHGFYVSEILEGTKKADEKLFKLKIFWEYFLLHKDKKIRKKILKSRSFEEYKILVEELSAL